MSVRVLTHVTALLLKDMAMVELSQPTFSGSGNVNMDKMRLLYKVGGMYVCTYVCVLIIMPSQLYDRTAHLQSHEYCLRRVHCITQWMRGWKPLPARVLHSLSLLAEVRVLELSVSFGQVCMHCVWHDAAAAHSHLQ